VPRATHPLVTARRVAFLAAVPLLALPWISPSSTADLSSRYTDHLRHAYAVQVFLAKGFELNRVPFAEAAAGVTSRHPGLYWPQVPYAYPPGALLLFLPVSLASEAWVDAPLTHARLLVTFTTALALLAWFALLKLLRVGEGSAPEQVISALFAVFGFLALLRAGLEGFYDSAWVALGIAAILALEREAFAAALALCAAAAAVHLRAAALAPVAVMAFVGLLRTRGRRAWLHPAVLLAALVAALDVWVFFPLARLAPELRGGLPALASKPAALVACAALSVGAAALCVWRRRPLAAASVAVVLLLALGDSRAWWHASLALIPLFLFASARRATQPVRRADVWVALGLLVWAVQLQRFAWGGRVWDLPQAVGRVLTGGSIPPVQ